MFASDTKADDLEESYSTSNWSLNIDETTFSDPLESVKGLLFSTIFSQRLAWFYNNVSKQWDIVYKVEPSSENSNFWIVTDCNEYYYAVNKNNLRSIPPNDQLSVKQVITTILHALSEKFAETTVTSILFAMVNSGRSPLCGVSQSVFLVAIFCVF